MISKYLLMKSKLTPELTEIAGIMFGDGQLSVEPNYTYRVRIWMNLEKDKLYAFQVKHLFRKNFAVELKEQIDPNKNSLALYHFSKKLVYLLHQDLFVPLSPKLLSTIPQKFKEDKELLSSFIRGLFDTDGCVTHQKDGKYYYVLVEICTKFLPFAEDIKDSLSHLGIKSFICKKKDKVGHVGFDIVIRHKNAVKFFDIIGSKNPRNIEKWKQEWGRWDSNI